MKRNYLTRQAEKEQSEKEIMTLNEAAEFLGICRQSLRKYSEQGRFHYKKCGNRYFFSRRQLLGDVVDSDLAADDNE